MKAKILVCGIIMFLAMALTAAAGDISGKWIVTAENVDIQMVFKVDGNTMTGTIYNPFSGETKIKEGKVDGTVFRSSPSASSAKIKMRRGYCGKGSLTGK